MAFDEKVDVFLQDWNGCIMTLSKQWSFQPRETHISNHPRHGRRVQAAHGHLLPSPDPPIALCSGGVAARLHRRQTRIVSSFPLRTAPRHASREGTGPGGCAGHGETHRKASLL